MRYRSIALIGLIALLLAAVVAILYFRRVDTSTKAKAQPATPLSHWDNPNAPMLLLLTNGSDTTEVVRGWPLIVELHLLHPQTGQPQTKAEALAIISKEGAWTKAIHIEIADEKRVRQSWPLSLAAPPAEKLSLGVDRTADVAWLLSPEETSKLNPGKYKLTALLDTTGSSAAGAWKGKAISMTVDLTILDSSTITPAQESEKFQLMARYHLRREERVHAMKQMDELLAKQPRDVGGLALKGDLLVAEGKPEEALRVYNDALDAFYEQHPNEYEPPTLLLDKQHALLKELFVEQRQ